MNYNQKFPDSGAYPAEDSIRIEAGGNIEKEVELKVPEVVFEKGEKYAVSVKGLWMHVVIGDHTELKFKQYDVVRGGLASEV